MNENSFTVWYLKNNNVSQLEAISINAKNKQHARELFQKICKFEVVCVNDINVVDKF